MRASLSQAPPSSMDPGAAAAARLRVFELGPVLVAVLQQLGEGHRQLSPVALSRLRCVSRAFRDAADAAMAEARHAAGAAGFF